MFVLFREFTRSKFGTNAVKMLFAINRRQILKSSKDTNYMTYKNGEYGENPCRDIMDHLGSNGIW